MEANLTIEGNDMFRKVFKAIAVGVLTVSTLSAAHAQQSVKLGIGVTSDFLAAYMALDQGLFEKRGLKVTPVSMAGATGPSSG